jgi:hypothetical protein
MWVLGRILLLQPPQPRAPDGLSAPNPVRHRHQYPRDRPALPMPELTGLPAFAPAIGIRRTNLVAAGDECAAQLSLYATLAPGPARAKTQARIVDPFLCGRARVGAGFCLSDGIGPVWKSARGGFLGVLGGLPRKYYIISSMWRPCWHPLKSAKSAKSANILPVASLLLVSHLRAAVAVGLGGTRAIFHGCRPFLSSYQC